MESNSSAKPIDKNTLHAKVRISHVLVNKPLVIFWKTRTGLNLCNKQFNCTSNFPSDLYLLGPDHTFTFLHSEKRGWVCCQAGETQSDLREGRGIPWQATEAKWAVSSEDHTWSYCSWRFQRGWHKWQTFQCVKSRKTHTSSFSQRVCSVGEQLWALPFSARASLLRVVALGEGSEALCRSCLCWLWGRVCVRREQSKWEAAIIHSIIPPLLAGAGP